jgi:hypothetical protein
LDGTNWYPFNTSYAWNKDGYIAQFVLPTGSHTFYVREVGQEGDVATVSNYNLVSDLESHGLHPVGSSPKIISSTIEAGSNKTLVIQTIEPNQVVRVYSSVLESGEEKFGFSYPIVAQGISDGDGVFIATLPTVRANQKFCPTAQGIYELESIAGNIIIAGVTINARQPQLDINVAIGNSKW